MQGLLSLPTRGSHSAPLRSLVQQLDCTILAEHYPSVYAPIMGLSTSLTPSPVLLLAMVHVPYEPHPTTIEISSNYLTVHLPCNCHPSIHLTVHLPSNSHPSIYLTVHQPSNSHPSIHLTVHLLSNSHPSIPPPTLLPSSLGFLLCDLLSIFHRDLDAPPRPPSPCRSIPFPLGTASGLFSLRNRIETERGWRIRHRRHSHVRWTCRKRANSRLRLASRLEPRQRAPASFWSAWMLHGRERTSRTDAARPKRTDETSRS